MGRGVCATCPRQQLRLMLSLSSPRTTESVSKTLFLIYVQGHTPEGVGEEGTRLFTLKNIKKMRRKKKKERGSEQI